MNDSDKVKALAEVAKVLNDWDIISISSNGVHCREKFFVDHFEPENIEDTGKYVTATAHADGVAFYALFQTDRSDLKKVYQGAVERIKGVAA